MFRSLFSAVSIVVLVASMLLPTAAAARRCEDRMPLTLLALYRGSESIYVGRYEKTEDGEPTEETADYTVVPVKKHFTISSALKGESRKMLTFTDNEYRYKTVEVAEDGPEHGDGPEIAELDPGDPVLLFVKKNEETQALEPADFTDGIKKMTPEKLYSYEARIRELKSIFGSEKPGHAQLVDWMIKCIEDPETRWEGSFELLQSFQNLDWQEERAKEETVKPAGSEADELETAGAPKDFDTGDPSFARNVTEAQKNVLTGILLNSERQNVSDDPDAKPQMVLGDRELVELVKRWGDSRVASHLLEQLRQDQSDAYQNSELMASIASILKDDELMNLSTGYADIQWESDDQDVAGDTQTAPSDTTAEPMSSEESSAADAEGDATSESGTELPKKKTYGELKAELLAKFLSRADRVIAVEQSKANAKAR